MAGVDIPPGRHDHALLQQGAVHWVLTVDYGGHRMYLSTEWLDITDAASGRTFTAGGHLSGFAAAEGAEPAEAIVPGLDVPVEVVLPVLISQMEGEGHRLEGSAVEVARWVEGTDWGERRIVARGLVDSPEYGADDEPVAFSVADRPWAEVVMIPAQRERVDGDTWSTATQLAPEELGLAYPIVIGTPGKTDTVSRGWVTGSQVVWVERNKTASGSNNLNMRCVVSLGHVQADRLMMSTDTDVDGFRFRINKGVDELGTPVSFIDAYADIPAALFTYAESDGNDSYGLGDSAITASFTPPPYSIDPTLYPVFCGWYDNIDGHGGVVDAGGQLIRGAGDVMAYLAARSDQRVDHGAFAAAAPRLNVYNIDAVIDARTFPIEWIRTHLLPVLPVSLEVGPNGLLPIVWNYFATDADATVTFDDTLDPTVTRASRVRVDSSRITNRFTLNYALSIRTGGHHGTVMLDGAPYDANDSSLHPSLICRISQQRYKHNGGRPYISEEELTTSVIYETATALRVLAWRAAAYALGRRSVDIVVPEADYGHVQRGQVALLTLADVRINAWVCLITAVQTYDDNTLGISLLNLESPARDGHNATGYSPTPA